MAFLKRNILTFHQATEYIRHLPYGRNADKTDLKNIFTDNKGTCSTKHALLQVLAEEQGMNHMRLMLGIFRMNAQNTPKVGNTLREKGLEYLPEAHNYLSWGSEVFDFTRPRSSPADFIEELLFETSIQAQDIDTVKVGMHRDFLKTWLSGQEDIHYTLEELWEIREQCIRDLSV